MRKQEPQVAESMMIPVLKLKTIERGRKIYRQNDLKEFHWQLSCYRVKGIDNDKGVLICTDSEEKPTIIPFSALSGYFVMKMGYADPKNLKYPKRKKATT